MFRCAVLALTSALVSAVVGQCADAHDYDSPSSIFLQTAHWRQREEKYHWPSGRGRFPFFAVSEHNAPFRVNDTLAWSWHHPEGRFHTLTYGTAIAHWHPDYTHARFRIQFHTNLAQANRTENI
eukprot:s534_g37.t1